MPRGPSSRASAREGGDGGLASGVQGHARPAGVPGQAAADVDDAPALAQVRQRRLGGDEHGAHVDVHRAVVVVGRDVLDRPGQEDAGVVDQDIEAAQVGGGPGHGLADLPGIGRVGGVGVGAPPGGAQFFHQRVGLVSGADVGQRDVRAVGGQAARDGRADAAACAGDESNFSVECGHGQLHLCSDQYIYNEGGPPGLSIPRR